MIKKLDSKDLITLSEKAKNWFAKLLKAEGKSEEAAVEYSQLLKSRDISKQQKGKIDFGSALLFIRYTIESAAAQSKVGQIDAAIATDVDGLSQYTICLLMNSWISQRKLDLFQFRAAASKHNWQAFIFSRKSMKKQLSFLLPRANT